MAAALKANLEDADQGALDAWLLDSKQFGHPSVLRRIPECLGCADVQDILANALSAHRTFQDMYGMRAELAKVPEKAELFRQLAEQQQAEAQLQARDLARLDFS